METIPCWNTVVTRTEATAGTHCATLEAKSLLRHTHTMLWSLATKNYLGSHRNNDLGHHRCGTQPFNNDLGWRTWCDIKDSFGIFVYSKSTPFQSCLITKFRFEELHVKQALYWTDTDENLLAWQHSLAYQDMKFNQNLLSSLSDERGWRTGLVKKRIIR
jgi:hypothetical protein